MDKETLEKLADKYQQKADRAFDNYQETGAKRYYTERENAEDLADALRMAANAADEHAEYLGLKAALAQLFGMAQMVKYAAPESKEEMVNGLVECLLAHGRMRGMR